jgi:PPP family 3-phenylpropionic acid transporter
MPDPAPCTAEPPALARAGGFGVATSRAALGAYYFAFFGALGLHVPYFPLWLELNGFRGLSMGAIAALVPALSFVGPPLVGWLSDSRGARGNLLSLATALSCLSLALLGVAQATGVSRVFWVVFPLTFGFAACRSSLILLADRIALERGGNYGRRRVWGSIGFLLVASSFGASPDGFWIWTPACASVLFALAFGFSLALPRVVGGVVVRSSRKAGHLLSDRRMLVFLACASLFMAGHTSYDLCGSLFFRDLGASGDTIGLLWSTGVIAEIAILVLAGPLVERIAPHRLLAIAYCAGALRWLLTSRLPGPLWAFPVQALHGVTFGLTWLASLAYVRRAATAQLAGSAQGLFMAAQATGGVLGMLAWGPLYERHGGRIVFTIAGCLAAGAAITALALLRDPTPHPQAQLGNA